MTGMAKCYPHICRQLAVDPAQAILVGDTPADMQMGRAAGVGAILGVLSGTASAAVLEPLADIIRPSIADLADFMTVGAYPVKATSIPSRKSITASLNSSGRSRLGKWAAPSIKTNFEFLIALCINSASDGGINWSSAP